MSIHLQDYDQLTLQPVLGRGLVGKQVPIDGSPEGRVFSTDALAEQPLPDGGVRLTLPMLDGSDRVGMLSFTLPSVGGHDRQLAHRVAGLVADLVVTKDAYTDTFARVRTTQPMSLAAQLQWQSLPPLSMTTPDIDLAGILEPAYEVGGDSFDYAFDDHVLHLAIFDAMGHGLEAVTMATVVLAGYRHGRRRDVPLAELYGEMDAVVARSFPGCFATGQLGRLDTATGELCWVNAGDPPALWVRRGRVVGELTGAPTRLIGLGSAPPRCTRCSLSPATGCCSSPTAWSRNGCGTASSSARRGCAS